MERAVDRNDNTPSETAEAPSGWRSALVPAQQPEPDADLEADDAETEGTDDTADLGEDTAADDGASHEEAPEPKGTAPENPDDYELAVKGHTWSESDAPILESFATAIHAAGVSNEAANAISSWYVAEATKQAEAHAEAQRERDAADKNAAVDALTTALGEEAYLPGVRAFKQLLGDTAVFGKGVGEQIAGARLPDGRLLINEPSIARFFISAARSRYAKGGTREVEVNKKARLAEIEKVMKTNLDSYFEQGLDQEYLSLLKG